MAEKTPLQNKIGSLQHWSLIKERISDDRIGLDIVYLLKVLSITGHVPIFNLKFGR